MQTALYLAAALVLLVALAHSYLGERYLLAQVFRNKPSAILDSRGFAGRTLRVAWHITSIAWLGFAALLVLLALGKAPPAAIAAVIGWTFLVHGVVALVASRGNHLSWILFLTVGALAIYAQQV